MKKIVITCGLILLSGFLSAQTVLNYKSIEGFKEELNNRKEASEELDSLVNRASAPLDYGYIEDKDVLWSKVTWEIIDFNERLNQPYYHTSPGVITNRKSLFDALVDGIRSYQIRDIYEDEYFNTKMRFEEVLSRLEKIDTSDYGYEQLRSGEDVTADAIDRYNIDSDQIKMLKIKGMWYIDRRLGEMKYRLLGVCIMGPDAQTIGTEFDDGILVELFWVYYPDAREFLSNFKVFNPSNSSSSITYDDILNARRFSSIIYKAETAYGEKPIEDYIPRDAKGQIEEHNRIKASILQQESDMWNY